MPLTESEKLFAIHNYMNEKLLEVNKCPKLLNAKDGANRSLFRKFNAIELYTKHKATAALKDILSEDEMYLVSGTYVKDFDYAIDYANRNFGIKTPQDRAKLIDTVLVKEAELFSKTFTTPNDKKAVIDFSKCYNQKTNISRNEHYEKLFDEVANRNYEKLSEAADNYYNSLKQSGK